MFDTMKVAKKIKTARIQRNLTQMQLADEMGVSYQAVSNWERGNSMPDISKLTDLCRVLGLSLEELLGEQESAAHIAEKVMQQQPVAPQELAQAAPLLPPRQLESAVRQTEQATRPIDMDALLQIAPYLDDEYLEKLVERVQPENLDQLVALAPFLEDESLEKLVERVQPESLDQLVALAPFLEDESLEKLVKRVQPENLGQLVALAPFLEDESLEKLVAQVEPENPSELAELAPFLGDEALDRYVTRYLAKEGCDVAALTELCPFLGEETVRKIANHILRTGEYGALAGFAPYL